MHALLLGKLTRLNDNILIHSKEPQTAIAHITHRVQHQHSTGVGSWQKEAVHGILADQTNIGSVSTQPVHASISISSHPLNHVVSIQ